MAAVTFLCAMLCNANPPLLTVSLTCCLSPVLYVCRFFSGDTCPGWPVILIPEELSSGSSGPPCLRTSMAFLLPVQSALNKPSNQYLAGLLQLPRSCQSVFPCHILVICFPFTNLVFASVSDILFLDYLPSQIFWTWPMLRYPWQDCYFVLCS